MEPVKVHPQHSRLRRALQQPMGERSNRDSEGKDDECHADPVKTGADDLFLRLLAAEAEQSATHLTQFNADNHSHDRVKAIHAMRELLMALGIAGLGATNYDLGLMIASKTRHELAYRPKSWMHYDPAKGIWSESSSDEQLAHHRFFRLCTNPPQMRCTAIYRWRQAI